VLFGRVLGDAGHRATDLFAGGFDFGNTAADALGCAFDLVAELVDRLDGVFELIEHEVERVGDLGGGRIVMLGIEPHGEIAVGNLLHCRRQLCRKLLPVCAGCRLWLVVRGEIRVLRRHRLAAVRGRSRLRRLAFGSRVCFAETGCRRATGIGGQWIGLRRLIGLLVVVHVVGATPRTRKEAENTECCPARNG